MKQVSKSVIVGVIAATALSFAAAAPASATDLSTFANFQEQGSAKQLKWVRNPAGNGGHLFTVATAASTVVGAVKVFFSFPDLFASSNLKAKFTFDGTDVSTPHSGTVPNMDQDGINATFSFILDGAQMVDGVSYASGTNLLSGTVIKYAKIHQTGTTEGNVSASTVDPATILTYTSAITPIQVLLASSTDRGFSFALDGVNPNFTDPGAGKAFKNFSATVGGQLSMVGVPEPATWALMIGGFGMAGVALRRRRQVVAA